ncbi:hypothetical protein NKR23_g11527 [Pleurostoma richardsiae]|uniref:Uncharacterized protein n=1 Tax=Pleurostoma richardsiae TaxID=41990 RepID=A0AA38RH56_9PEZI|nr:hypothetical protein NKR23_g11527 [Pleurostoma richardsiae]
MADFVGERVDQAGNNVQNIVGADGNRPLRLQHAGASVTVMVNGMQHKIPKVFTYLTESRRALLTEEAVLALKAAAKAMVTPVVSGKTRLDC